MAIQDPKKKKKQLGPPTELQWLQSVRGKSLKSYQDTVAAARANQQKSANKGLVQWDDDKSIAPNVRQFKSEVFEPIKKAIIDGNTSVISKQTYDLIHSGVSQKFISPQERDDVLKQMQGMRDKLSKMPVVFVEDGKRTGFKWSPTGSGTDKRLVTHGDLITNQTYNKQGTKQDVADFLDSRVNARTQGIKKLDKYVPTNNDAAALGNTAITAIASGLNLANSVVDPIGVSRFALQEGAKRVPGLRPLEETFAPSNEQLDKYRAESDEGQAEYNPRLEGGAIAEGVRGGVRSVPFGVYTGLTNAIWGPDIQGPLRNSGLSAVDIMNEDAERASKNPNSAFAYMVGQNVPALAMSLPLVGAQLNAARTLGQALLAPVGRASLGGAIGTGVAIAGPAALGAATPFMPEPVAAATRQLLSPTDALWRAGIPEEATASIASADPTGTMQRDASLAAGVLMMGGPSIRMWKDVKTTADRGMAYYKHQLGKGAMPRAALSKTLETYGKSRIATSLGTEFAFGGGTPALHSLGQAVANVNRDKAARPNEVEEFDSGHALSSTILGLLFQTRVPHAFQKSFEYNPLRKMEARSLARDYAVNSMKGPNKQVEAVRTWFIENKGYEPNVEDVYRLTSAIKTSNDEALFNLMRNADAPDAPRRKAYATLDEAIDGYIKGDVEFDPETRSQLDILTGEVRGRETEADEADFSNSALSKINIDDQLGYDAVARHGEIQRITDAVTPHFEKLLNSHGNAVKETESQYWGVKLNDGRTMVVSKRSGNRRIVTGEDLKDVDYIDPFAARPATAHATGMANVLQHFGSVIASMREAYQHEITDTDKGHTGIPVGILGDGQIVVVSKRSRGDRGGNVGFVRPERASATDPDIGNVGPIREVANWIKQNVPSLKSGEGHSGFRSETNIATTEEFPTRVQIGNAHVAGRLIHTENGVGVYQTAEGGLFFIPGARGEVLPPIETSSSLTPEEDAVRQLRLSNLTAKSINAELKIGGVAIQLRIPDLPGILGLRDASGAIDPSKLSALQAAFLNSPQDVVRTLWSNFANKTLYAAEHALKNPVPDVGQIVTFEGDSGQHIVVHSNKESGIFLARPLRDLNGETTIGYSYDPEQSYKPWVANNTLSRDALERIHANASAIHGLPAEGMFPNNNIIDIEHLDMAAAMSNTGKVAGLLPTILNATPETLRQSVNDIIDAANDLASHPDLAQYDIYKSVEYSLNEWMKANRGNADIVQAMVHDMYYQFSKQTVDSKKALAFWRLLRSDSLSETYNAIVMSDSGAIATVSDTTMNSALPGSTNFPSLLSMAMRVNHLVFESGSTERRLETHIKNMVGRLGLDQAQEEDVFKKVKSLAYALRGVLPALQSKFLTLPSKQWLVHKFSGLPHEIQAFAYDMPIEQQSNLVDPVISSWHKSESKYNEAVAHAEQQLAGPNAEQFRKTLVENGYEYFVALAENATARSEQTAVRRTLRTDVGAAKTWVARTNDFFRKRMVAQQTKAVVEAAVLLHSNRTNGTNYVVGLRQTQAALAHFDSSMVQEAIKDIAREGSLVRIGTRSIDIAMPSYDDIVSIVSELQQKYSEHDLAHVAANDTDALIGGGEMYVVEAPDGREAAVALESESKARQVNATMQQYYDNMPLEDKQKMAVMLGPWESVKRYLNQMVLSRPGEIADRDALEHIVYALIKASDNQTWSLQTLFTKAGDYNTFINAATVVREKMDLREQQNNLYKPETSDGMTGRVNLNFDTELDVAVKELVKVLRSEDPADRSNPAEFANLAGLSFVLMPEFLAQTPTLIRTKQSKEIAARQLLREQDIIARNLKSDVQMARQYKTDVLDVVNARQEINGRVSNFMGMDTALYDPNQHTLISDAMEHVLHGRQDRVLTNADLDAIVAEANRLQVAFARLDKDVDSFADNANAAMTAPISIEFSGDGSEQYRDADTMEKGKKITAYKVYTKAGLEAVLLAAMKNELKLGEDVTLRDFVEARTQADEQLKTLYRTTTSVRDYLNRLVFQRGNNKILSAYYLPWETSVIDQANLNAGALDGQVFFNTFVRSVEVNLNAQQKTLFRQGVVEYINQNKADDGTFKFEVNKLAQLINPFNISLQDVMPRSYDGNKIGAPFSTSDGMSVAYRITGRLAAMEIHGGVKFTRSDSGTNNKLGERLLGYKNTSVADIASQLDISSRPESPLQLTANDIDLIIDDFQDLHTQLAKLKTSNQLHDESILTTVNEQLSYYRGLRKGHEGNDAISNLQTRVTDIVAQYKDATKLAKYVAEFHDMFATKSAINQLSYELNSSGASLNEYVALAIAAKVNPDVMRDAIRNNFTVGQLLGKDGIDLGLTEVDQAKIKHLRIAQMKQDFYKTNHQLLITTGDLLREQNNIKFQSAAGEQYGQLKLLQMDRQNNAMSHLLFLASQKGPERTAFTIAHEMGHFIFESLPDYLQVQYLASVIPEKGTYGQKQTTLQASHTAAFDLVNKAKAALHDWTEVQKNNPADFQLTDIEGWNGWVVEGENVSENNRAYLKELSTVALTNFILSDGVVMDDTNRNTRSEHAIGVLQGYGQVLRNLHQRIAHKAHDLITIDGKPYNGFFVDPSVNKFRYRANQLNFVSLRHGSNLHFIVPHLRGSTGSLLVRTPGDMMELSSSVPDVTTRNWVRQMLGSDSTADEVQAAVDGGYSFMASSVQSGPFFRASAETERFGYGRRVTGKVVGIVRATNFTTAEQAKEAGYDPAFMGINGNGKKVVWIHSSHREDGNNKWYSTNTRSSMQSLTDEGNATNNRLGQVGRDYAYVVESTGSIKLFKRRTGENEIGYETKTWDNVTTRHLVGHDAFELDETQRPYIVETGKIGNSKFNHVVYSMLSRVDQRIREIGGDLNYVTQVESQKALAREYSGQENGFTDVYTDAVASDAARSSGDIGEQLLNRDEKELKAIQLAKVGDWARLKAKAMSFTQWMTRNKGAVPESVVEKINEATDSMSLFRNKQNADGTYTRSDDPELSDWYSGLRTKLMFGGKSFDGQTMSLWLSQFAGDNFQDTLGRIYGAFQDHANKGTEEPFDFNSLGLNTEIMYGGRLFDMAPRLNEIFSDSTRDPDAIGGMLEEMYHGTMSEMLYRWLNDVMPTTDAASNGIPIVVEQLLKRGVAVGDTNLNPKVTFYGQEHDVQPVIDWARETYGHLDNVQLNQVTKDLRQDGPRPRVVLNDSAPLQSVTKAALNWVRTTVYRGDDGSFAEYMRDFAGENGPLKQARATNIFNATRFVQNIDSRMRRNALRNWGSWNIHDTSGDNVILRAPDKQVGKRLYSDSKYGSLISVNLVTGETAYVSENVEYRADGTRKSYKPIKTFDQFLAYQNTHSDFRHQAADNSKFLPVEEVFGDYASYIAQSVTEDPQYISTGKAYVMTPSKKWFTGSQHNDGGVMYQVKQIDGAFHVRELTSWWNQPNDVEQKDYGTMLYSAIQHLPLEQRSAIMKNRILSEEYHIARLLLAKDKLTDQNHSQQLARTSTDKNVFGVTEGKLQMRETSDNTWYSQDPTAHSVTGEEDVPYRWSSLEPPVGFDKNYDLAEAYYLARHADQTSAVNDAASKLPITLFNDPTLKAPIATTTQNGEFVVRINSKNWDEIVEPMNSLLPGTGKKKLRAAPGSSITITQTSAGKPFKNGILRMLGNDFRYILSNDLSSFAVQSFKAISGDPTLLFPAMLALPSLIAPNWRDLPFFVGPLLEKFIHEKHGLSAGFGDKYYDVLMNKLLRRYNRIAMARDPNAEEITWEQLIKSGYHSNYKDWMTDFESRQALNPSRYQKLTDTSFVPVDENTNQGILQELQPLFVGMGAWYSPLFWFPKRWDQTRLLMRDAMHLKHALDVMHSSHDLYERSDNEQADSLSLARQASNRRQAMRQVNLDFGLQRFTANDTQSPLAKNINAGFNFMQTAPAYHRNFLNSVPLLGEWSYHIRKGVNDIGNKIPSGASAVHGDVFDLTWEKSFYENSRTNGWARSRNNKRNLQQLAGMFGFSALAFMTGYLDHKYNEKGLPFDGMDVFNPGSKKFGFIRTSNNYLFAIPPLQRISRIMKPIQAFTGSTEYTPTLALQAAAQAAVKSYAASKFQNLYHIVGSSITGSEYMGDPSFEPNAGYLIAQKNGIYTPWTGNTQRWIPSQSNWMMNHMNLVLAQQAFEDYAKLGIIASQDRQDYVANGLFGAFNESNVPMIDPNQARAITNKTLIPRLLGFGIHYEPLDWRLMMKEKVRIGGNTKTTLARLIWLAQHDWFDFPSASEVQRNKGLNAILYGYPTNESSSSALGFPTAATINMSKMNPKPNVPMGRVQTEAMEDAGNVQEPPALPTPTLMEDAYGPETDDE